MRAAETATTISAEWITRELVLKTSITRENAEKIAQEAREELKLAGNRITSNLIKSILCLKLEQYNLIKEEQEYLRSKICYESFDPVEA